jgi:hypothetical protein
MGTPLPELIPEVNAARSLVNALPEGANVLVSVDYEPGFSGEMNAAASSLLDHLMIKGAYLTLVSTTPSGPAQAEQLVRLVNTQMGHHYQDVNQYTNLGFIAGGRSGLRLFAEVPQQVLPYSLDNFAVWTDGRLSNVKKISDFSMFVVITESPDTARAWIEQAAPAMGDAPLLMVVSAQAEPLVRPYYAGYPHQVDGLVVGLYGGASYESGMPRPALARRYWDAFSYAIPVVVLLILIGSLVNTLIEQRRERKPTRRETKI